MHLRTFAIAAVALALAGDVAGEARSSRFGAVGDEAYHAIEREVAASDAAVVAAGKTLADSCLLTDYRTLAICRDGEEIWTAVLPAVERYAVWKPSTSSTEWRRIGRTVMTWI